MAITSRQREAAHHYNKNLDAMWVQLNDMTWTIATTHKKSVHCVQNQLHIGCALSHGKHVKNSTWNAFLWKKGQDHHFDESKYISLLRQSIDQQFEPDASSSQGRQYLPHALWAFAAKYDELMKEEKVAILKDFNKYKVNKETGHQISTKSRVNDCTHTFNSITNEVFFLVSMKTNLI